VMAQRRSVEVAFSYATAPSPGTRANCWDLAEAAGHEGRGRMQAPLRSYAWDWRDLRAELPRLAATWLPDRGAAVGVEIVPVLCPAVLCGQRRLAVLVAGGERLGGAAAGHIIFTVRRAS
jgi:hypothetical protein